MEIKNINDRIAERVRAEMEKEWREHIAFFDYIPYRVSVKNEEKQYFSAYTNDIRDEFKRIWFDKYYTIRFNKAVQEFIDKIEKLTQDVEELRTNVDNIPRDW